MQRRNSGWGSVIQAFLVGAAVGRLGTLAVLYIGDSGAGHAVLPPGNGTASGNSTGCEARADALIIIQEPAKVRAEQTWCGKHHFGLKEATSICLHERTALSLQCSLCFGGETLCGKTKCLSECVFGPSLKCSRCTCDHCGENLLRCVDCPPLSSREAQALEVSHCRWG